MRDLMKSRKTKKRKRVIVQSYKIHYKWISITKRKKVVNYSMPKSESQEKLIKKDKEKKCDIL